MAIRRFVDLQQIDGLPILLGERVLGLQVGQDLGVLALAEPEPGVLALVAVGGDDMGAPGGAGGAGHRMESLPPGDTPVRRRRRFGWPG